jgi:hypothetical protein
MKQRRAGDRMELLTVADTAVVLPSRHLTGIGRQIPGDMVVRADLGATQAGEEAFSLIGAGRTVRVAIAVIDALGRELGVQRVPALRVIGIHRGALGDMLHDRRDGRGF